MRTRIKICGIASADEARLAIDAGVDALGFNSVGPSSPRYVADATVAAITTLTPPPVATFLLTVERTADAIAAHVRRTRPSTVQILWGIDPAESARLAEIEPDLRRVQVVHVESRAALELIPAYSPYVHAFLLDSGSPSAAAPELGGTGRPHDWAISAEFVEASPLPVFLAGGLTPANVGAAIRQVRPFGVDLSSGVRTAGQLDPAKVADFALAVRKADDALNPT
ncbi:phosphoribosylanthranilate isomerase [Bosea sp. BIWAKO-01]|uniref:phosphoribosylanthranilate isomerase n=1 Tax=Bosea sp. BIWAKO-01 TaxID=506668 RepID=UPI00086E02FC|nr:phosphoribosylanthranilate isomerase [Bosea sp. BIWAKO-01]GAU86637.1 phosphoribosylanthranilate isomerase [Bosea sp. BIWAKO-01]